MGAVGRHGGRQVNSPPDPRWQAAQERLDDARRLGVSITTRLADEFTRLLAAMPERRDSHGDTSPDTSHNTGRDPSDDTRANTRSGDSADRIRAARRRAERSVELAIDSALDAMAEAIDIASDVAQEAARFGRHEPPNSLCATAQAGSVCSILVWLHNTTSVVAPEIQLHLGELRSRSGTQLSTSIEFVPTALAGLAAGTSASVSIVLTIAADAAPGTYFGLVFAEGIDEPPMLLTIEVGRS